MTKKGKGWHGEPRRHSLARQGVKTVLPDGRRLAVNKFVADGRKKEVDFSKSFLTEDEINLIKNRANRGDKSDMEEFYEIVNTDGGYEISPEQTEKGYGWLMNLYKTPYGKERKNNPFGLREMDILDNFDRFKIIEFYNAGNAYRDYFVPYYEVISKDGRSFEYARYGGEIHILG